jgi:site-specific DNA-methyltransferase (adenine-specific)
MTLKPNGIYNIDCIEGLRLLRSESIDLIITSPPYNLGNNHHTRDYRHQTYDDDMEETLYQRWQKEVLDEAYRVLKKGGSLIYNHKNRFKKGRQITPYQWILKTDFIIKQETVWRNGTPNFDKIRFYPATERIYWLAKDESTVLENVISKNDLFEWNPVGTKGKHKRQYPLELVLDHLKVFPNAEIVLDPFIGSGTTAVGCIFMDRKYIGFDIEEEFVKIAQENIEKALKKKEKFKTLDDFF